MRYFDVSFSFSLDPIDTNVFGRDGLDIHPDGPPPGTHGCIGLVPQTREQLEGFRDLLRPRTTATLRPYTDNAAKSARERHFAVTNK